MNKSVQWAVQEGFAAGSILNGVYTAPTTLGTYHVVATSVADASKSAVASIAVADTAGLFYPVQNMSKVSSVHTATLLPSGQVLVTGGCIGYDFLEVGDPYAEVYDPAATTFTETGNMISGRCRHAATLLPNGNVLLAGGFNGGGDMQANTLSSTELYDPSAGTLSSSALMLAGHADHTATFLPNGKVLIAGGGSFGGWGFPGYGSGTATSELYDPSSNSFTYTGAMATGRFGHTATLLANGKVLVIGR